jgi:perosamine synthetase
MSKEKRYWHTEIGYNYRMTNIQAALGLAQLERIDELLCKRSQILEWYRELLGSAQELTLNPSMPWAVPACWMVCALLAGGGAERRDHVCAMLREKGVDTRPFFHPLSAQPMYGGSSGLPRARDIAARGFNLPSSPSLSHDDVAYIANAVRESLV